MKHWFFYKVYMFDKRLFLFLVIFSGLTIVCNLMGDEVTPFFVWGMYSEKEDPVDTYEVFRIRVNDSELVDYTSGFTNNNRFFLSAPLSFYHNMQQHEFVDRTIHFLKNKLGDNYATVRPVAERVANGIEEQKKFAVWYKKYLEQTTGKPIRKLTVDVINMHLTSTQPRSDSSYQILSWEKQ